MNTKVSTHLFQPILGLVLVSLAGFALEITLTRLFSVLFFYNYVFILISLAILGIGIGAALVHHLPFPKGYHQLATRLKHLAWGGGASVILLAICISIPWTFDPRSLLLIAALIPYGFIGALSASLFQVWSDQSGVLYAADLVGGALGILAALAGLAHSGGMNTLLVLPIIFGMAGLIFYHNSRFSILGILLTVILLGQNLIFNTLQINPAQLPTPKPLTRLLTENANTQVAYTQWDPFGRVDVLEDMDNPTQKLFFIDGAAGSVMYRYPQTQVERTNVQNDLGYFPFESASPEHTLIIGPGGGKDILFAHLAGTQTINAVEISPSVVNALNEFGGYNGNLATLPGVKLILDEGRSYLRRSGDRYDMIYLSEVTSLSAELAGYILAENYIYTTQAVHDYLDHLTPDGWLVFKLYDEFTLTRAFTTVVKALVERGSSQMEAARHVMVILDSKVISQSEPFRGPLLMVARQPLSADKGMDLLTKIQAAGLIPVFVPHALEQGPLGALIQGSTTFEAMIQEFVRGDVRPTTDNAPFFYEFEFGLPLLLRKLLFGLAGVTISGIIYLAWRQRMLTAPSYLQHILYFAGLGVGFLFIEAGVIQYFSLFLGHPTRSLSVVLLALLIGGGIGSGLSQRMWRGMKEYQLGMSAAVVVATLTVVYSFGVPHLFEAALHFPLWGRVIVSWVLLLPLGIFLGVPFPVGLRATKTEFIPLAWGINGLGTVLGAVGAMTLAMTFNFQIVLLAGGCFYLFTAVWARSISS